MVSQSDVHVNRDARARTHTRRFLHSPRGQDLGEGVGPDDPAVGVHGEEGGSPRLLETTAQSRSGSLVSR